MFFFVICFPDMTSLTIIDAKSKRGDVCRRANSKVTA